MDGRRGTLTERRVRVRRVGQTDGRRPGTSGRGAAALRRHRCLDVSGGREARSVRELERERTTMCARTYVRVSLSLSLLLARCGRLGRAVSAAAAATAATSQKGVITPTRCERIMFEFCQIFDTTRPNIKRAMEISVTISRKYSNDVRKIYIFPSTRDGDDYDREIYGRRFFFI